MQLSVQASAIKASAAADVQLRDVGDLHIDRRGCLKVPHQFAGRPLIKASQVSCRVENLVILQGHPFRCAVPLASSPAWP